MENGRTVAALVSSRQQCSRIWRRTDFVSTNWPQFLVGLARPQPLGTGRWGEVRSGPRARGASGPILLLFQPSSEVGPRANHSRSRFLRDSEATGIGPSLFPHKRTQCIQKCACPRPVSPRVLRRQETSAARTSGSGVGRLAAQRARCDEVVAWRSPPARPLSPHQC